MQLGLIIYIFLGLRQGFVSNQGNFQDIPILFLEYLCNNLVDFAEDTTKKGETCLLTFVIFAIRGSLQNQALKGTHL